MNKDIILRFIVGKGLTSLFAIIVALALSYFIYADYTSQVTCNKWGYYDPVVLTLDGWECRMAYMQSIKVSELRRND